MNILNSIPDPCRETAKPVESLTITTQSINEPLKSLILLASLIAAVRRDNQQLFQAAMKLSDSIIAS